MLCYKPFFPLLFKTFWVSKSNNSHYVNRFGLSCWYQSLFFKNHWFVHLCISAVYTQSLWYEYWSRLLFLSKNSESAKTNERCMNVCARRPVTRMFHWQFGTAGAEERMETSAIWNLVRNLWSAKMLSPWRASQPAASATVSRTEQNLIPEPRWQM